jgi:beta-lactamase regulating signal transducer with metallopeptidase domain
MNELGLAMLGCALRCAVVGLAAVPLVAILAKRRGPAAGASAAQAGLNALMLTVALSLVAWPRAWSLPLRWARAESPAAFAGPLSIPSVVAPKAATRHDIAAPFSLREVRRALRSYAIRFDRPLIRQIFACCKLTPKGWLWSLPEQVLYPGEKSKPGSQNQASAEPRSDKARRVPRPPILESSIHDHVLSSVETSTGGRWPARVAWIAIACWALSALRLLTGLCALRRQVARSQPIEDIGLHAHAERLRAELGFRRRVVIRESSAMTHPATFGWLRPCILLPEAWRGWTLQERQVVLAHELAHVHRGDYATRLAARICVAVHFYHPVAHWLAARLRLFQELAADAMAIPLCGGRATYLTTLARMALRHDDLRHDWVGRPQLSFGGSFLRRIDMLCNQNRIGESPASSQWGTRLLTLGLLVAVALVATAVRTPLAPADDRETPLARVVAQEQPRPVEAPFDLTHVSADAVGIVAIRPAAILAQEEIQPLASPIRAAMAPMLAKAADAGITPDSIDQVLYVQLRTSLESLSGTPESKLKMGYIVVRTKAKLDAATAVGALGGKTKPGLHSNRSYTLLEVDAKHQCAIYQPDGQTVIIAMEETLHRILDQPSKGDVKHGWAEAWQGVNRSHFALAFDVAYVRDLLGPIMAGNEMLELTMLAAPVAPIWEGARSVSMGMNIVGDQIEIQSVNTAGSVEAAETTHQTIQALLTLARNASGSLKRRFRSIAIGNPGAAELLLIAKLADLWAGKILQGMQVERTGNSVRFSTKVDLDALVILMGFVGH